MRIDSATIGMDSARSYRASNVTTRKFAVKDYNSSLNAAIGSGTGSASGAEENTAETKTENGEQTVPTMQEWKTRFQAHTSNVSIRSSAEQTYMEIQSYTIRYIFDLLFAARRNQFSSWLEENGGGAENTQGAALSANADTGGNTVEELYDQNGFLKKQPGTLTSNLKVLNYSQETYFEESESVSFSTVGTVKTADGREINFNVNVGMSREFQKYYREDLNLAAFTMCDPLVINLETDAAQLEDQTFYFDIDGDGEKDEVAKLSSASGYLALDKNGDGVVNDGSELFGTESGNGFADLAKYDEDGNGWIDENDAVWDKLQIWTKDADGKDVLYGLSEKGVGAICLQNASTDFTQKNEAGKTLGAVRSTGIFLYENGNVGTVQHLDVAKYK